jgi:histidine triad (HIT) family protein
MRTRFSGPPSNTRDRQGGVAAGGADAGAGCPSMLGPVTDDFYCEHALSGKTLVDVVAETDDVLAFHHTRPFWPVHIVVIPKRHIPSLTDLGDAGIDAVHRVLAVARTIAAQVTAEHGAARVLTNLGAYQDSKHLHFHVSSGEPLDQV